MPIPVGMTGAEVRRLRRRLKLTQSALAKRIGVDVMTVSRWERGVTRVTPPVATLLRLLAAKGGTR